MKAIRIPRLIELALGGALVITPALPQQTINNASISGRVTDPSGQVIENARVVARQLETKLTQSTSTDTEGRFRFPYLRVGAYEISFQRKDSPTSHES